MVESWDCEMAVLSVDSLAQQMVEKTVAHSEPQTVHWMADDSDSLSVDWWAEMSECATGLEKEPSMAAWWADGSAERMAGDSVEMSADLMVGSTVVAMVASSDAAKAVSSAATTGAS